MIGYMFGFDGLAVTELSYEEYDALWAALNSAPRRGREPGRLTVFSGRSDSETGRATSWGFPDQDAPALAEWVPAGAGCRHWLFAAPRDEEDT